MEKLYIDFSKIKKIKFNIFEKYNLPYGPYGPYDSTEKYSPFFKYIFSQKDIINNLIYLKFEFSNLNIKRNYIEKINELRSLKYLKLTHLNPDETFKLKLNNLERLTLCFCSNIAFKNKIFLNLKELKLKKSQLVKIKENPLLECPLLDNCIFEDKESIQSCDINLIIDFSSIINLKSFEGNSKYFVFLGNPPIEKAIITKDEN